MIVDSAILVYVSRIGKLHLLRRFFGKIKIHLPVYRETVEEREGRIGTATISGACNKWIEVVEFNKEKEAAHMARQEDIAKADAILILLCEREKEGLLINDAALVQVARSRGIECWWMTTLLLKSVAKGIITKSEAKNLLADLIHAGMRIRTEVYILVLDEIDRL